MIKSAYVEFVGRVEVRAIDGDEANGWEVRFPDYPSARWENWQIYPQLCVADIWYS